MLCTVLPQPPSCPVDCFPHGAVKQQARPLLPTLHFGKAYTLPASYLARPAEQAPCLASLWARPLPLRSHTSGMSPLVCHLLLQVCCICCLRICAGLQLRSHLFSPHHVCCTLFSPQMCAVHFCATPSASHALTVHAVVPVVVLPAILQACAPKLPGPLQRWCV